MPKTFRNTAGVVLLLVLIAGLLYAYYLSIPAGTAAALIAAFAIEAALYLVHRMPRDMHSLCGVLDRLDEAALAAQRRLTVPFLRQVLEVGQSPAG